MLAARVAARRYTVAKPHDSRALACLRLFKEGGKDLGAALGNVSVPRVRVRVAYRYLSVVEIFFV